MMGDEVSWKEHSGWAVDIVEKEVAVPNYSGIGASIKVVVVVECSPVDGHPAVSALKRKKLREAIQLADELEGFLNDSGLCIEASE